MKILSLALMVAAAASSSALTLITNEHADIGLGYTGGWDLHVHDETNDIEYAPEDALFFMDENSRFTNPGLGFLGQNAGETMWWLRDFPTGNQPFLGVGAEETDLIFENVTESDSRILAMGGAPTSKWITLELVGFRGPGNFAAWSNSIGGPVVWMATNDGIQDSDKFFTVDGSHQHLNFAFTATGVYELDFRASAIVNGQRSYSEVSTYKFGVEAVPEPATLVAVGTGLAALLRRRRK